MKTRMLLAATLTLLLLPNTLWAMEEAPAADTPAVVLHPINPDADKTVAEAAIKGAIQTRIYALKYYEADQLAKTLWALLNDRSDITLVPNPRGNQILVSGSPAEQEQISALIQSLDTPRPVRRDQDTQMMCRVYMLELPSADPDLKRFSVTVEGTTEYPASHLMAALQDSQLQVDAIRQRRVTNERWELTIGGRAFSKADVTNLIAELSDALMKDWHWLEPASATGVLTSDLSSLSQPLQEHLHKLLGEDLQTVGYWFGDLSSPGRVRAPIGPWLLQLEVEPEQGDELMFTVGVEQPLPDGSGTTIILSNSGRSRVGKPIIIGYNRDRDGTRAMGALVILPEPANPAL